MSTTEYEKFVNILTDNDCMCRVHGFPNKPHCEGKLRIENVKMYPHEAGIEVPDKKGKQWVYVVCPECDHELSWDKLIRKFEALKKS